MDIIETLTILIFTLQISDSFGQYSPSPASYHYDTTFPEIADFFETTLREAQKPNRLHACSSLRQRASSPSFQQFEEGFYFGEAEDSIRLPPSFPVNLFTPNTIEQPAETMGQIEQYRKAMEDEARESQNEMNGVVSGTQDSVYLTDFDGTRDSRNQYVRVQNRGYNYSFSI